MGHCFQLNHINEMVNKNLRKHQSSVPVFLLQTCLRHPDSRSAKGNREGVFKKMREAMATITSVVQEEHKDETLENGGLAMDLSEFEVSSSSVSHATSL